MYKFGMVGLLAALLAWMPIPDPAHSWDSEGAGFAAAQQEWNWKGRVERGDAIEVIGVNGEINAERASGNEVEVETLLEGKKSDPKLVKMEVVEHDGGVTICAVYPTPEGERPNECLPGGKGRNSVKKNDVSVEFTVRVPAGVNLIGRTVNGEVRALGIEGDVEVHTVNGDVDISASGLAEATTVNGSITASMGRTDWSGKLGFTTVNGSVTLELPADLNCDVSVSTVNGQIASDFALVVEGRFSPRSLKGTIGDGGRGLIIKTVNGSVQIRRA